MERTEVAVEGRRISRLSAKEATNCRLKRTREQLANALAIVEEEIDGRLGKGGGGLR